MKTSLLDRLGAQASGKLFGLCDNLHQLLPTVTQSIPAHANRVTVMT